MNLDRAQVEWTLGRFPWEELPELAAQMMMQGHDGAAILELASLHMPHRPCIPPALVDAAFLECGRPPFTKERLEAVRVEQAMSDAETLVVDCLQGRLSVVDLGYRLWRLASALEDPWSTELNQALGWHLQWEDASSTAFRKTAELELLKAAGRFLQSRKPR